MDRHFLPELRPDDSPYGYCGPRPQSTDSMNYPDYIQFLSQICMDLAGLIPIPAKKN